MKHIGIDLGTTNTVAAFGDRAFGAINPEGGSLLPSVVAFPPNGARLIGTPARRRKPIDPRNTIYSSKRLIGRKWYSPEVKIFAGRYPFDLEQDADEQPCFKTRAGRFTPTEIACAILEHVGKYVDENSMHAFSRLTGIVAVPTQFGQAERAATIEAGMMSGLSEVRLIDEPLATAYAYIRGQRKPMKYAAVYDLGGGTFDLAVVDCSQRPLQILAHGGDLYLGGDDIDRALADWVSDQVLEQHHWDLRSDAAVQSRLVVECEQAKIRLVKEGQTRVDLTRVDPASPVAMAELSLSRETVAELARELIGRTFVLCDEVLTQSGLKREQLDGLCVAGGATQLPVVQEAIARYFGKPVRYIYHPMQTVAIGASLAAEYI